MRVLTPLMVSLLIVAFLFMIKQQQSYENNF